jgi:hypothetical protein
MLPVADDFCRAALDRYWLGYVVEMYRTWTGRWVAMALYALVLPREISGLYDHTSSVAFQKDAAKKLQLC